MSESSSSLVECPVCEAEFDPTAAGGWCTNSECGEWHYDGADHSQDTTTAEDEGDTGVDDTTDDAEAEPTPAIQQATADDDTTDEESGVEDVGAAVDASVDAAADTAQSAAETVADDSDDGGDDDTTTADGEETVESTDEPVDDEPAADVPANEESVDDETEDDSADGEASTADESAAEETTAAEEIVCPGCEATLDADANFCPSCGEDVSAIEPGADEDDELTECPGCGADVGPEDSFCASCGEDLDAHREAEELTECPDCGAGIDPEDSFCVSCGANLDAHRQGTAGGEDTADSQDTDEGDAVDGAGSDPEPAPETLVLDVRGEKLTVSDGDTVGRELRRIITETGGDEDDAVRVHREHVRFVRENGQFYLEDMGRNPTELNGTHMEEGDRKPVGPGDELTLSGVVTLAVGAP